MKIKYGVLIILTLFLTGCGVECYQELEVVRNKVTELENKTCNTPVCPAQKICPTCPTITQQECSSADETFLEGKYMYKLGQWFQIKGDKEINKFEDFYYDREYKNCSRVIEEGIDLLDTANGFFINAEKLFKNATQSELVKAYTEAAEQRYKANEDYLNYLGWYEQYCNANDDGDLDSDPRELSKGEDDERRYIIHLDNYEKQVRIIDELDKR